MSTGSEYGREVSWRRSTFKAMGGPCEIRLFADSDEPIRLAIREIERLERKYSRYLDDSVTSRINARAGAGPSRVDDETMKLLRYADNAWMISDGLFDITSGVYRAAWNFRSTRLPSEAAIEALRRRVGWEKVKLYADSIELALDMEIDLGGIVKEYAADRCAAILRTHADCGLVELAGDIAVTGPLPDGSAWQVRIRHPRAEGTCGELAVDRGAVATSGDYERCIVIDGRRYCHLLDPRTGWPVEGLASVTVRHESCTVAGTLATVAMLKGRAGENWLLQQDVHAVCIPA